MAMAKAKGARSAAAPPRSPRVKTGAVARTRRPPVAPSRPSAADESAARAGLADLRRRQILDAAEECFRQRGFHNASMAEIAKTFGMSAGHIYNYFDSKEAIIAGIVERDLALFMQRSDEIRGAADIPAALLARVDEGVADKLNPGRAALQFEVLAEAGRNPQVLAMVRAADVKVRDVLRELFRHGRGDRQANRDLDGKIAVLMALFDGLMSRGLRQPEIDRAQMTRALRAVISDMVR